MVYDFGEEVRRHRKLGDEEWRGARDQEEIVIPELEKPENARWLALLIDTEGALGWVMETERRDRINEECEYVYTYRVIY
ncbi:MAG: hypothetical protein AOA65_0186 [Candidatus Bathyarchaeota archaeon BA1]|nr:MAG: hypothetical protein AOA65_0186 [Candidatus Bathyarchaeota archaeon BA1]